MSRRSRISIAVAVSMCAFYGAVSISISHEVKNPTSNEAFAMRFDETYAEMTKRLTTKLGRRWEELIDYQEILNEAESLAHHAGSEAPSYLKSQVEGQANKPGITVTGRLRLAFVTLAKVDSDDARETLRNFLSRDKKTLGAHTLLVISYLPQDRAKAFLEDVLQNPNRIVDPTVLELGVSLLAAIGDNKSMTVLKSLNGKEKQLPPDFLTKAIETIQDRLDTKSQKERSERTKHELLYWQTQHDQPVHRVREHSYRHAAKRLHERHLKLPADLLLSKLPDPTAIAILSIQREVAAIPELQKLTTRDGMIGLMAKKALEAIRNPPAK